MKESDLGKNGSDSSRNDDCSQRVVDYLSTIVSAATFAPPGVEVNTAVQCRRRPDRKPCHGLIRLCLNEEPPSLFWWCPECGDEGTIKNWKGMSWNRHHTSFNRGNSTDEFCEVLLTDKEYQLLRETTILDSDAASIVNKAIQIHDGLLLEGQLSGMDSLIGYIAFESNHEQKIRRRQALNKIFDKIHNVLEGHW